MDKWEKAKKEFRIIGFIIIFIPIFFLNGIIKRFDIYKNGKYVLVEITDKSEGGGNLTSYWIDFTIDNKTFSRQVGSAYYNEFKTGDKIKMKTDNDYSYFLFETEKPIVRFFINLIPLFIGLILILVFKK